MATKKEKKNTEISARVNSLIKDAGETPNSFAKALGYTRAQTLYDILNGKAAPSYDFFNRFAMSEYSAIYSLRWLLAGIGDMRIHEQSAPIGDRAVVYERDPRDVQLIAAHEKTIERDEELLATLRQKIRDLEQGRVFHETESLVGVRSSSGVAPQKTPTPSHKDP